MIIENLKDFKKLKKLIKKKRFYKRNISKILNNNFTIGKTKINFFNFLKDISS